MKNFLDGLNSSPSITGLASPPTPRSMASAVSKGQPFPFPVEATTAPRLGNMPGSSTSPDFAGFIEAQKAMFESFKAEKRKPSEDEKPKVKRGWINHPRVSQARNLQVLEDSHEGSNQSCK